MRYKVQGARKETGEIVTVIIEASSEPRAQFKANQQGIRVERCKQISMAQAIPSMDTAVSRPAKARTAIIGATTQHKTSANAAPLSPAPTPARTSGRHSVIGIAATLFIVGGGIAAVGLWERSRAIREVETSVQAAARSRDAKARDGFAARDQGVAEAAKRRQAAEALTAFLTDVEPFRKSCRTYVAASKAAENALALMHAGEVAASFELLRKQEEAGEALFAPAHAVGPAAAKLPRGLVVLATVDVLGDIADLYTACSSDVLSVESVYRKANANAATAMENSGFGRQVNDVPADAISADDQMMAKLLVAAVVPAKPTVLGQEIIFPNRNPAASAAALEPTPPDSHSPERFGAANAIASASTAARPRTSDTQSTPTLSIGVELSIEGLQRVVAADTGLCVSLSDGGRNPGDRTLLMPSGQSAIQRWRFESVAGSSHRIVSEPSGLVLGVRGNSNAAGTDVIQWQWTAEAGQQWRVAHADGDCVRIVNVRSGLYLTAPVRPSASLTQESAGSRQLWRLAATDPNGRGG